MNLIFQYCLNNGAILVETMNNDQQQAAISFLQQVDPVKILFINAATAPKKIDRFSKTKKLFSGLKLFKFLGKSLFKMK